MDESSPSWITPPQLAVLAELRETLVREAIRRMAATTEDADGPSRGVEVDISGADAAYGFEPNGTRRPLPNRLSQRVMRSLAGMSIPCQRLEDLIAYKTVIGRTADLRELLALQAH